MHNVDRFLPPTGFLAGAEDYPVLAVGKETITARWSRGIDQVRLVDGVPLMSLSLAGSLLLSAVG